LLRVQLLAVALAVSWKLLRRYRAWVAEWRQRPVVPRDAELICVESAFRSTSRWPIVARVDRAYRLPSGLVVLVELNAEVKNLVDAVKKVIGRDVMVRSSLHCRRVRPIACASTSMGTT
jgi:hypothetical protein